MDANTIISGLVQRGMPLHVAQGVAANMRAESGFNTGINEIAPLVPGSRGGFGLNQWTGPRRNAYEAFARERGVPASDLNAQLDFTMQELQGPEAKAWQALQATRDAIEAARVYSEQFLRPGIPNMDKRLQFAREIAAMPANTGGQPMARQPMISTQAQPEQQQRRGLLGINPDVRDRLIMGLEGMTLNPNQALMQQAQQGIQQRRETAQSTQAKNRTVEWLRSQGRDDLAAAVESGAIGVREAAMLVFQQPAAAGYRQVKGSELGMTGESADALFNVGPDGKVTGIGGASTTIHVGESGPQIGTIPQGFQLVTDDAGALSLQPIPGGPADTSRTDAMAAENQAVGAVNVLGALDSLRSEISGSPGRTTGLGGSILSRFPGTAAFDAEQTANTIKANLAFDALAAMRAASPTGGALGAVSERELGLLESQIANLNLGQSQDRVLKSIDAIEEQYKRIIRKAYETGEPGRLDELFGGRPDFIAAESGGFTVTGQID